MLDSEASMTHLSRRLREPVAKGATPAVWTFFRQWLKNPLGIAAMSPSSQRLAREMIAQLPADARRVVELGGGTGVFTQALLERGVEPEDLLVVELNDALHRLLQQRFPSVHVVRGDARELETMVRQIRFDAAGPVDAVLSGLGLL